MWLWLKKKFRPSGGHPQPVERPLAIDYFYYPDRPAHSDPEPAIKVVDYYDPSTAVYRPVDPVELLNVHFALVEQIYQASGMTRHQFHDLILPILIHASSAYQLLPASQASHHRELGGLLLHSLQVVRHAVHLGQVARFERDLSRSVAPQDQRLWSFCLALAAATHDVGKPLTDFRVVHPTFFTPGRLLPRLGEGPPAQDEPALYNPFRDTLYDWQVRNGYGEYTIRWLDDRFNRHKLPAAAFRWTWMGALDCRNLPEKFMLVLEAERLPSGTIEADFWRVVAEADARSAAQYFPAATREPGLVVADCLRDLVRRGLWRPTETAFPLLRLPNGRLLLRAPTDLSELSSHIADHPEGRLLTTSSALSPAQLASLMQFGSLLEAGYASDPMYQPDQLGLSLPSADCLVVLAASLSSELTVLAASAPQPPVQTSVSSSALSAPPPSHLGTLDLAHLANPVAAASSSLSATIDAAPQVVSSVSSDDRASQSPTHPNTASRPTPAPEYPAPEPIHIPSVVYELLQYVQALNPQQVFRAQSGLATPAPDGSPASWLHVDNTSIHLERNLIKRFAKRSVYQLDHVFQTLIDCTAVVATVTPPPPAPTELITLDTRISRALLRGKLAEYAKAPLSESKNSVDPQLFLQYLLREPPVSIALEQVDDILEPITVPIPVVVSVLSRLDPSFLDQDVDAYLERLISSLQESPFRIKRSPDGLVLLGRRIRNLATNR